MHQNVGHVSKCVIPEDGAPTCSFGVVKTPLFRPPLPSDPISHSPRSTSPSPYPIARPQRAYRPGGALRRRRARDRSQGARGALRLTACKTHSAPMYAAREGLVHPGALRACMRPPYVIVRDSSGPSHPRRLVGAQPETIPSSPSTERHIAMSQAAARTAGRLRCLRRLRRKYRGRSP